MKSFVFLLVVCALATAMVPRQSRHALNPEEEASSTSASTASEPITPGEPGVPTTRKKKEICAPQTPCAWSVYKPVIKMVEFTLKNNYCECSPNLDCIINEDDTTVYTYVHRCRVPETTEHADIEHDEQARHS